MSDQTSSKSSAAPPEQQPGIESRSCLNCGSHLTGKYCSNCGQQDKTVIRILPSLVAEAFAGLFAFNSRTYNTLWYLLSRPAFLASEYLAGKRASYLPPLRLFILSIVILIFSISLELFLTSVVSISNPVASEAPELDSDQTQQPPTSPEINLQPENQSIQINDMQYDSLQNYFEQLKVPLVSDEMNQRLILLLQHRAEVIAPGIFEDPVSFFNSLLDYVPIMMLVLVPVLALIQQVVYLGSRRYYVEHLILTINNHSFLFIGFIVLFLLGSLEGLNVEIINLVTGALSSLVRIWLVVYLFLSLKLFFKQGYFVTSVKFLAASITYGICLSIAMTLLVLYGFLTY